MANFAESFAQSFVPSFQQAQARGAPIALEKFKAKQEMERFQKFEEMFAQETAGKTEAAQGRVQVMEQLNDIGAAIGFEDADRKAAMKIRTEQLRKTGVPIDKGAEQVLTNLIVGDNARNKMDNVTQLISSDPGFTQEFMAELLADPNALVEYLAPALTLSKAQADAQKAVETGNNGERAISVKAAKAQFDAAVQKRAAKGEIMIAEREMKVAQKMMQAATTLGTEAGKQKAQLALDNAEKRLKKATDAFDKFDDRQFTIANEERINAREAAEEQARFERGEAVPDTYTKSVNNLVKEGIISPEKRRELLRSKAERTALGDQEISLVTPEGMITAKGQEAWDKAFQARAGAEKAKNAAELDKAAQAIIPMASAAHDIITALEDGDGRIQSVSGAITRGANLLIQQAQALGAILEFEDGTEFDVAVEAKKFGSKNRQFAALSTELQSAIIQLAYADAKADDPAGRISDKDFDRALEKIGGSSGDPGILARVVSKMIVRRIRSVKGKKAFAGFSDEQVRTNFDDAFKAMDLHPLLTDPDALGGLFGLESEGEPPPVVPPQPVSSQQLQQVITGINALQIPEAEKKARIAEARKRALASQKGAQ